MRLYNALGAANVDRKRLLPSALRHLTHTDKGVRHAAIGFVGNAGTAADAGPLLVLVSDPDYYISVPAAAALGKIGDDRTVIALDLWLQYNRVPGDRLREMPHVTAARDQIQARLAAEAAKPAAKP